MTIGELSTASGVPASTLRYWERMRVLPKAMRFSGQRRYQRDAIHVVAVLLLAKTCGFSLDEMRRLMTGFRPDTPARERWETAVREHQKILESQIVQLNTMRKLLLTVQRCQCVNWVECGRIASDLMATGLRLGGARPMTQHSPRATASRRHSASVHAF